MHTSRWSVVGLFVVVLAAACTRLAVPPPISLPPPAPVAPPQSGQLPPEVAHLKTPPWLRLEAVWATTDNLHHPTVRRAAFAPDGRTLVTVDRPGRIRLWDLSSRTLRRELDACEIPKDAPFGAYPPGAWSMAVSPDGLAAVGFVGGKVCVVELATGRLVRTIDAHAANVVSVAFAAGRLTTFGYQETIIAEASIGPIVEQREGGGEARWWDPRTGAKLAEVRVGPATAMALSSDGTRIAVTTKKGVAAYGADGRALWERSGLAGQIAIARMPLGGDRLLVAGERGLIALSADTGMTEGSFEPASGKAEPTKAVAVSPDGRFAASITDAGALVLWDARARREIARRKETKAAHHDTGPATAALSPDGAMLATCSEGEPAVWRTAGLDIYWSAAPAITTCLSFTPDGRRAFVCAGAAAELRDVATGQIVGRYPVGYDSGILLPLDEGTRAVEVDYTKVRVRVLASGETLWSVSDRERLTRVLPTPDGRHVAIFDGRGNDGLRLHDATTGEVLWNKHGPTPRDVGPEPLSFSLDGRRLFVRTRDWHVLALDTANGKVRADIDRERTDTNDFVVTPDGKRALAASPDHLSAYDLSTGKRLWQSKGTDYRYAILANGAAFLSHYETIRLRAMATGQDLAAPFYLQGLPGAVLGFALSPDGKTLLLRTNEGIVLRFGIDLSKTAPVAPL